MAMSARLMGAYIETAFLKSKYNKEYKQVQELDLVLSMMKPRVGPYTEHKDFLKRAQGFVKEIADYSGPTSSLTINYGDSIVDMWRDRWQSHDLVFSVGGMHHYHMLHMAQVLKPVMDAKKLYPKFVTIGTLGGNPLLQHQEISSVIAKSIECLNGLRALYPASFTKLIVYGLPPVTAIYASAHSFNFEQKIYQWVVNDSNAVFIPMFKQFGTGFLGLTPKSWVTAEGIHLSPVGQVLLDERFEYAKSAKPKSIVDYC